MSPTEAAVDEIESPRLASEAPSNNKCRLSLREGALFRGAKRDYISDLLLQDQKCQFLNSNSARTLKRPWPNSSPDSDLSRGLVL